MDSDGRAVDGAARDALPELQSPPEWSRSSRYLAAFRRPWRALPELDAISDAECRALAAGLAAQRRAINGSAKGGRAFWAMDLLSTLFIATIVSLCFQIPFLPLMFVGVALAIVSAALSVHNSLPNRVRARFREDGCQGCAYPLYELPACTGPMECPRCRRPCIAREVIRSAADLLACNVDAHAGKRRRRRPEIVEACACGYPLHGLPTTDEMVSCPECGSDYRVHKLGFVRAPGLSNG